MKNFSDLLATKLELNVLVNGQEITAGLLDELTFNANDIVIIDGIEILPKYHCLSRNEVLTIPEPFYQWYHRISGQGWLLVPHSTN